MSSYNLLSVPLPTSADSAPGLIIAQGKHTYHQNYNQTIRDDVIRKCSIYIRFDQVMWVKRSTTATRVCLCHVTRVARGRLRVEVISVTIFSTRVASSLPSTTAMVIRTLKTFCKSVFANLSRLQLVVYNFSDGFQLQRHGWRHMGAVRIQQRASESFGGRQ